MSSVTATTSWSPSCSTRAGRGQLRLAEADQPRRPGAGRRLQLGELAADPALGDGDPHEQDLAGGLAPQLADLDRQQLAQQPVHRPGHGGDAGDAHALVDLGPLGVVDPGDDVLDAEGLPGHPGADDVGVVAAADRGERAGRVDAGVEQRLPVEAEPGDLAAGEVGAEPAERLRVLVDHRDAVPDLLQPAGDGGADAAAAHHDHVHEELPAELRRAGAVRPRSTGAKLHPAPGAARAGRPVCAGTRAAPAAPGRRGVRTIAPCPACPASDNSRNGSSSGVRSAATGSGESLLPKRLALPIFASDALSSVAYATQEILIILTLGGTAYLYLAPWLAAAVVVLLIVVVLSYRQVVHAYPSGGGDYEVAMKNHGQFAALVVASALLIDYVLTVAVSVSSGTDNIISAFPSLNPHRVLIAVGAGGAAGGGQPARRCASRARPSPCRPTCSPAGIMVMIVTGLIRQFFGHADRRRERALRRSRPTPAHVGLTGLALLFFALRAFASGTTALTGIEAVANGVPAFKPPKSRNAAITLSLLGGIAAHHVRRGHRAGPVRARALRRPAERLRPAGLPELRDRAAAHGRSPSWPRRRSAATHSIGFFYIQAATALVLILAANTAFNGFPLLGSVLAQDRFLPRQLHTRGDKLVYSNGILLLAGFAALLIVAFDADVTRLIQLYIIGVFTSFSIGQWGMVRHWHRELRTERDPARAPAGCAARRSSTPSAARSPASSW